MKTDIVGGKLEGDMSSGSGRADMVGRVIEGAADSSAASLMLQRAKLSQASSSMYCGNDMVRI
ncbi:hypothetical protein EBB07_26405 [Paenibacillaceae bacterium]|nr:hypothetical protein EBB07_26405 [Paenibacillaceae bacterium]